MTTKPQHNMNRRRFLSTVGAAGGTAAFGMSGVGPSAVQEGDAALPLLAAGAAGGAIFGGGLTLLVADANIFGSDPPPDALGPEALKDEVEQTITTRKSTNASTLKDNKNLITYVKEPAFVEGKKAAVKAINDEKTKSEVQSAAVDAANNHFATVENNLLNTWNESVNELESMYSLLNDAGVGSYLIIETDSGSLTNQGLNFPSISRTLSDGSSKDVKRVSNPQSTVYDPTNLSLGADALSAPIFVQSSRGTKHLVSTGWRNTWDELQTVQNDVSNNLTVWVDTAYSQVQAGDLRPSQLLSPSDLSEQYQGENTRAIADLQALNIPNAGGNEATIELSDEYTTRMTGLLAYSGGTSDLSEGDTVNPDATDNSDNPVYPGSWYISHDTSQWSATTTQYHDSSYGIQGGNLRLTRDPNQLYGNDYSAVVEYVVETTDGETATFVPEDTTKGTDSNSNTIWEVDLSDQLSQSTTSVNQMQAYTKSDENVYETTEITDTFEIIETSDGSLSFEQPRDPQTDSNYLTDDEWRDYERQTRENINSYESAGSDLPGIGDITGGAFSSFRDLAIAAVLVILGLFGLNAASG